MERLLDAQPKQSADPVRRRPQPRAAQLLHQDSAHQDSAHQDSVHHDVLHQAPLRRLQRSAGNAAVGHLLSTSMPATARAGLTSSGPAGGTVRRCGGITCPPGTCDHDGRGAGEHDPMLRRHQDATSSLAERVMPGAPAPAVVHETLRSPGSPLDAATRREMEQHFGHDLGAVRLHTDPLAQRSAHAVQALAYTVGLDVVLGAGQRPDTAAGRRVLAHELAHVVQYARGEDVGGAGLVVGEASHPSERAAEAAADAVGRDPIRSARTPLSLAESTSPVAVSHAASHGSGHLRRQPLPGSGTLPPPAQLSSCRIEFRQGTTEEVDASERDVCLQTARAYVAGGGARTITLHGYASEEGDAAFNADLARRRAERTRRLLIDRGVPEAAVSVAGHGADRTYPGLAPNRRVEVVLTESITFPGDDIAVAKYRCGPDVTAQVGRAVAKARSIFAAWTPDQRTESCEDLRGVTTGSYAWDIVELHNNAWILGYRPHCASAGATPACGSTVQVGADCYYAGSPNYVIFGTMCRLCYDHFHAQGRAGSMPGYTGYMDFTEASMLDLIDLYKSGSPNVGPSKAWSVAGRDGWPGGGTPPRGDRPGCAPQCSVPYSGSDFTVNWYPYEFHTGGGGR